MLSRIPGIDLALRGGRGRGLGSGAGEILINGQRITGKSNGGRSALARISADQVEHIEIIRGTSTELDVEGRSDCQRSAAGRTQSLQHHRSAALRCHTGRHF